MLDGWDDLKHFNKGENWGDWKKMQSSIVREADRWAEYIQRPVILHRGYVAGNKRTHGQGLAIDCHVSGMSLIDQFISASRFNFMGIGVYPEWNNPGLHLDMRAAPYRALWGRLDYPIIRYVGIDKNFIKLVLSIT